MSQKKATTTTSNRAVHSKADLFDLYGNGKLLDGYHFTPTAELDIPTAEAFLGTFTTRLCAAVWVTKLSDNSCYFLVYEVLKAFLHHGRGKRLHLVPATVEQIAEVCTDLYAAYGEVEHAGDTCSAADNEFVIMQGTEQGPIKMVVQVKPDLPSQTTYVASSSAFCAELLAACCFNAKQSHSLSTTVYGCVTNAYTWQFHRAIWNEQGWMIERAEEVTLFHHDGTVTLSTLTALNLFFTALLPDMVSGQQTSAAQQAVDAELTDRASKFTQCLLLSARKDLASSESKAKLVTSNPDFSTSP